MRALAVLLLGLLFLVELAAWASYGVAGRLLMPAAGIALLLSLPLVVMTVWGLLASPRARYGGPRTRLVVRILVLGGAVVLLLSAGQPVWAAALLAAIVVVHAGLAVPPVAAAAAELTASSDARPRG